jgi:peptide deformylase
MEEGCLSFPKQFIEIERPASIEIKYTNENNKIIEEKKNGHEARVLQHEIDHLSGKLFVDYISSLKRSRIIKRVQKLKKMGEI